MKQLANPTHNNTNANMNMETLQHPAMKLIGGGEAVTEFNALIKPVSN